MVCSVCSSSLRGSSINQSSWSLRIANTKSMYFIYLLLYKEAQTASKIQFSPSISQQRWGYKNVSSRESSLYLHKAQSSLKTLWRSSSYAAPFPSIHLIRAIQPTRMSDNDNALAKLVWNSVTTQLLSLQASFLSNTIKESISSFCHYHGWLTCFHTMIELFI